ncbi:DUF2147 domain-containing protein [Chitinophaga sp. Cy-1792]|nr:DUF2147 domain-containing protein [Chitinophaga sp. Cy-1792]
MEIFKDGGQYRGRMLWGADHLESDGKTSKKDSHNPDEKLRSRNIIGIVNLNGLKWDGKEYIDGVIYDPRSGKSYKCKAWMEGDKFHLRGFIGVALFGQTVTWHRYLTR